MKKGFYYNKYFNCDLCNGKFDHSLELKMHKTKVHNKVQIKQHLQRKRHVNTIIKCDLCGKQFAKKNEKSLHALKVHFGIKTSVENVTVDASDQKQDLPKTFLKSVKSSNNSKVSHITLNAATCSSLLEKPNKIIQVLNSSKFNERGDHIANVHEGKKPAEYPNIKLEVIFDYVTTTLKPADHDEKKEAHTDGDFENQTTIGFM